MNPLISILIPVYNGETTITRALDSIKGVHPPSHEIVIYNDGSEDNTSEVVFSYINLNPDITIRYIDNKSNGGIGKARNRLLEEASAKYIWFLDSDDYFLPDWDLANLITIAETNNLGIIETAMQEVYPDSTKIKSNYIKDFHNKVVSGEAYLERIYSFNPSANSRLYNLNYLQSIKAVCAERRFEDVLFSLSAVVNCKKMMILKVATYGYEKIHESIMRSVPTIEKIEDSVLLCRELEQFYQDHKAYRIILKTLAMSGIRLAYSLIIDYERENRKKVAQMREINDLFRRYKRQILRLKTLSFPSKAMLMVSMGFFIRMKQIQNRLINN